MFKKTFKILFMVLVWLLGVVIAAMHAVGDTTYESAGQAVNVTADADISAGQVAYADGWLGIAGSDAESGDSVALDISRREFQLQIPTSLDVVKGDTIYIDVADLTGNTPDSTAYATTSGGTKIAAFKATSDHWTYDSLRYVTAIQITY
jgi:predicted RecA/RadA family phage recombinase